MEQKELYKIADKYWKGECSSEEESKLRDALRWGNTPEGLEPLADYLSYTEDSRSATLPDQFDQEILSQIRKPKGRVFNLSMLIKVAASVVLLVAAVYMFQQADDHPVIAQQSEFIDTYQDSEEAYRQVKSALMMVSTSMNNGMAHTQMLGKFDEASRKIRN